MSTKMKPANKENVRNLVDYLRERAFAHIAHGCLIDEKGRRCLTQRCYDLMKDKGVATERFRAPYLEVAAWLGIGHNDVWILNDHAFDLLKGHDFKTCGDLADAIEAEWL